MTDWAEVKAPGADELWFLPLGGTGDIGMNLNLYGHAGKWLMVDLGVTFPEEGEHPGVEVLMPDPSWIVERKAQLAGQFLEVDGQFGRRPVQVAAAQDVGGFIEVGGGTQRQRIEDWPGGAVMALQPGEAGTKEAPPGPPRPVQRGWRGCTGQR